MKTLITKIIAVFSVAIIAFMATIALPSPSIADATIKVYVLTGQSNSLGCCYAEIAAGADYSPGNNPADAATPFFWSNVWDAGTAIGDSGGEITTLQMQQGCTAGGYTHPAFWGPELGFARKMYAMGKGGQEILIIKASRAGGGNTYWSKETGGHMYSHIISTVKAATDRLVAEGINFEIAGLMYLQGESDDSSEANIAGTRLNALISNLRTDLPNAENIYAVIAGISAGGYTRDVVRARQAALASSDPTIDYFSNLDLGLYAGDMVHLTKASKLTVGERFADSFLAHVPEPNSIILLLSGSFILTLLLVRIRLRRFR